MALGDKGATLDGLKASHDNLDGKIANLKSDLSDLADINANLLAHATFETGGVDSDTGADSTSTTRIRSSYIPLDNVDSFDVSVESGYKYYIVLIANGTVIYGTPFSPLPKHVDIVNDYPTAQYLRIVEQKTDNTKPDTNYVTATYTNKYIDLMTTVSDSFAEEGTQW